MDKNEIKKLLTEVRKLKSEPDHKYFLLLSDQTCIVGSNPMMIMKRFKREFKGKTIVDMYETDKRINSGVTSLSKLIEYDPAHIRGLIES